MAAKKTPKIQKPKLRSRVKASAVTQRPTYAELRQQIAESAKELQGCRRQLTESLEQQTATSEVLKAISHSAFDLQPVLETLIENATRLCGADSGFIFRMDGNLLRSAVAYNVPQELKDFLEQNPIRPDRGTTVGRVALECRVVHIPDVLADPEYKFPMGGGRTILGVPMLRQGALLGMIQIRRTEVRPFTDKQIELVTTFADQAVIAIENVRLFNELKESLEQQTATSEILSVIASSPTDIQPVLDVVAATAARLCEATDAQIRLIEGDRTRLAASFGTLPAPEFILASLKTPGNRAITTRRAIHVDDLRAAESEFPDSREYTQRYGTRTHLSVPLLREETAIGSINIRRTEVRPFTEKQVKLLETFADQAVIAIENVRLFNELKESLEQQTATSEILGVIASSPTDIQPVLNAVAENAARLCEATDAQIRVVERNMLRRVAHRGPVEATGRLETPISRSAPNGRAVIDKQTIHIHDIAAEFDSEFPESTAHLTSGSRTILVTPLLREGISIGTIMIRRIEVRPFSPKQIKLLETFAAQAVIAIENVWLFKELQDRNAELREALEHQTATAEVLSKISRSPTDVQPVLDAIVESAAKVCGIDDVVLRLREGNAMVARAHFGPIPHVRVEISCEDPRFDWMREHGPLHIPDIRAQHDFPTLASVTSNLTR